jgi:predicted Zn finger-like uncharacterized protein
VSSTLASFNVQCPSCDASFPVDSGKVPDDGIYAICSQCQRTFLVERPEEAEPADFAAEPADFGAEPAAAATEGEAETEEEPEGGPPPSRTFARWLRTRWRSPEAFRRGPAARPFPKG